MMKNKKDIATTFLNLCAKGKSREAFEQYASKNFKHHNAYFKGDATSLMEAMEESAQQNPDTTIQFHKILQDANEVAVYSHVKHKKDDLGYAVMHIFRFENDKITEAWDFGQAVPDNNINENGMF